MVNADRNLYEPPYDDALLYDTDLEPERPRSRPLVVLLGVVVLAAFGGVVWVAYNQGIKQGQSGLPVLTADAGPTRIVPDAATSSPAIDPAPDKSYDRLMNAEPEGDQVNMLPKPEQPRTAPSPQELAVSEPQTKTPLDQQTGTGGKMITQASDFDIPGAEPGMDSTVGTISGASEDISSSVPSATPSRPIAPPPAAIAPQKPVQPKATPPAPKPIAPPKPEPIAEVDATPAPAPAETPAAATGSVTIQLGSFPNAGLAASAWSKIKSSNQELLNPYNSSIKPAEIEGKGTWFRLRVGGIADKATANSICDKLKSAGQACIIAAK